MEYSFILFFVCTIMCAHITMAYSDTPKLFSWIFKRIRNKTACVHSRVIIIVHRGILQVIWFSTKRSYYELYGLRPSYMIYTYPLSALLVAAEETTQLRRRPYCKNVLYQQPSRAHQYMSQSLLYIIYYYSPQPVACIEILFYLSHLTSIWKMYSKVKKKDKSV